jgi:hypothetical protein
MQNFFSLDIPVEVNGAAGAGTVTQGIPRFPHFIARLPGELKGRTFFFFGAVEDVPARCQHHEVAQTGQGETPIMDQAVDLVDLSDIKGRIEAVVGVLFPQGLDEALLFIFPNPFLRKVNQPGDFVNEKQVSAAFSCPNPLDLSPGHKQFYKKNSLNNFYL